MERRKLKVGMEVGVRPANRAPSINPRPAVVRALIDSTGFRQNRALVEYEDNGVRVEMSLSRLVRLP